MSIHPSIQPRSPSRRRFTVARAQWLVDKKEEDEGAAASAANEENLKFSLENEADEDEEMRAAERRSECEAAVVEESEQRERLEKATGVRQPRLRPSRLMMYDAPTSIKLLHRHTCLY